MKYKYIEKKKFFIVSIFIIAYILLLPSLEWFSFSDEFDVMTGSWLISKGYVIYKDLFEHHMPLPYYVMAVFHLLCMDSPVKLRVGFTLIILLFWIFLYVIFHKKLGKKTILLFMILHSITLHYYWGNMMLADSFFGFAATVIVAILINNNLKFDLIEKIIISLMTFIAFTSTVISVYPLIIFYLYYIFNRLYLYFIDKKNCKNEFIKDLGFIIIVLSPFFIWISYMLITNSFIEFIKDAIQFNTEYYSKFTGEDTPLTLIVNYTKSIPNMLYRSFINEYNIFSYEYIFNFIITISPIIFLIICILEKKSKSGILIFLFTIFLRMRGDGFHGTPYYIPTLLLISIIINKFIIILKNNIQCKQLSTLEYLKNFIIGLYLIFISIWSYESFKLYNKTLFPLKKDLINTIDHSIIQEVTNTNDTIWAAPLFPEVYLFTKREPANKNIFYLPWQSVVPGVNEEIITNLKEKNTKVIYLTKLMDIWGYPLIEYGHEILEYIDKNYFTIDDYPNLYFNNNYKEEILDILLRKKDINKDIKIFIGNLKNETNVGNIINKDIRQSFFCTLEYIQNIQLSIATYAQENIGNLLVMLKDENENVLYSKSINLVELKDNTWLDFILDTPIEETKNKNYILHIQATSLDENSALTIYSSINDYYLDGTLSIDGEVQTGDLCFKIIGE